LGRGSKNQTSKSKNKTPATQRLTNADFRRLYLPCQTIKEEINKTEET
jgi:hypothetical protein